ncbi:hypothetical protein C1645_834786 [Glomus cerebriforme]|uniref:Uncharacterized protein n=1 Tax=Glomus cerebriforme TaxID=658196 RepID=A0A397S8Y5_9GLOM|nr:hypothetical protein C1645_834786 [Glomus cerebriforme]
MSVNELGGLLHEKSIDMQLLKQILKYSDEQLFKHFDAEDASTTKVEYITQKLIPIIFKKYDIICEKFKKWKIFKCSDAYLLWKNVININAELDLMKDYESYKTLSFLQTLDHFSKIPHWIKRLEELEAVVEIFEVTHNDYDWISESIYCWKLIKELSNADDFISLLKKIANINLNNVLDDHSDEILIQESIVSSFIQTKQFLLPLMNINKTKDIPSF